MVFGAVPNTSSAQLISELRVLEGMNDKRYTLPTSCVGASIWKGNIYAVAGDYIYRADVNSQRFFGYQIPVPEGVEITAFYGITDDGRMLLASGETMYSMTLPER